MQKTNDSNSRKCNENANLMTKVFPQKYVDSKKTNEKNGTLDYGNFASKSKLSFRSFFICMCVDSVAVTATAVVI